MADPFLRSSFIFLTGSSWTVVVYSLVHPAVHCFLHTQQATSTPVQSPQRLVISCFVFAWWFRSVFFIEMLLLRFTAFLHRYMPLTTCFYARETKPSLPDLYTWFFCLWTFMPIFFNYKKSDCLVPLKAILWIVGFFPNCLVSYTRSLCLVLSHVVPLRKVHICFSRWVSHGLQQKNLFSPAVLQRPSF